MMALDPYGGTRFAAIQELVPQALHRHYGLDVQSFDRFMVLAGGDPHTKWGGVQAALRSIPALDYRLIKEPWAFTKNRIAVRFAYEWHDGDGKWFRSYGNENWQFDASPQSTIC